MSFAELGHVTLPRLCTAALIASFLSLARTSQGVAPGDMAPRTWLEVPNTKLATVGADPEMFPGIRGNTGLKSVVGAWNSAALDTKRSRLILHGGGHADYFGNELYVFEIETLTWQRLTDPTPNPTAGSDINWDGTPQARHTYGGTTYIAHLDSFFVFGGSGSTIDSSGFPRTENVWTFDFGTKKWSYVSSVPGGPPHGEGSVAIYDPVTRIVWWGEGWNSNPDDGWGLWAYDADVKKWTHHTHASVFSRSTGCLDTKRGLLVIVGGGSVRAFDVRSNTPTETEWKTTGTTDIVGKNVPGVDYDPVADRIVAWAGGPVFVLDPETRAWTKIDATGAPAPNQNGTYRRFAYVPSVNAFASVNEVDANVFFFKHTAGKGEPVPDAGTNPDAGSAGEGGAPVNPGSGGRGAGGATASGGITSQSGAGGRAGAAGDASRAGTPSAPAEGRDAGVAAAGASDDGGCHCRFTTSTGARRHERPVYALTLAALLMLARRRQRPGPQPSAAAPLRDPRPPLSVLDRVEDAGE